MAFSVWSSNDSPWIIDSGATDHIMNSRTLFSSYSTCSGKKEVTIADGNLVIYILKRFYYVPPSISLSSVFHVPNGSHNLLSVSSITKSLNCPSHSSLLTVSSRNWEHGRWLAVVEMVLVYISGERTTINAQDLRICSANCQNFLSTASSLASKIRRPIIWYSSKIVSFFNQTVNHHEVLSHCLWICQA